MAPTRCVEPKTENRPIRPSSLVEGCLDGRAEVLDHDDVRAYATPQRGGKALRFRRGHQLIASHDHPRESDGSFSNAVGSSSMRLPGDTAIRTVSETPSPKAEPGRASSALNASQAASL